MACLYRFLCISPLCAGDTATLMHRFDQRYKRGETFFFFQNLEIPMNTRYRGLDNKEARVVVIESVELVFLSSPSISST